MGNFLKTGLLETAPGRITGPTREGDRCCSQIPLEGNGSLGGGARHTFQVLMPPSCPAPASDGCATPQRRTPARSRARQGRQSKAGTAAPGMPSCLPAASPRPPATVHTLPVPAGRGQRGSGHGCHALAASLRRTHSWSSLPASGFPFGDGGRAPESWQESLGDLLQPGARHPPGTQPLPAPAPLAADGGCRQDGMRLSITHPTSLHNAEAGMVCGWKEL